MPDVYKEELKRSLPPMERLANKFNPSCGDDSSGEDEDGGGL
jgi:hypothetical protein